ncbi:hypothetical protein Cabther_B0747 [Chloracidobacterium thermophilum B]|uniref:Uncharacterized protein n=1 Tax=Chloracidobacterium thermophilum (strain B) TaxID=981222 RepID=G2LL68_CHLTF|nr:hypothetical protein Cabther_B0747 [Chloracidobacterium thermophilum B]
MTRHPLRQTDFLMRSCRAVENHLSEAPREEVRVGKANGADFDEFLVPT